LSKLAQEIKILIIPPIAQSMPAKQTMQPKLAGWRVLVVDDVEDNLALVEIVFNFYGAEVRTARNGKEGLAQVDDFKPSLILLDLSMPEMDGWTMRKQLLQNLETAAIPVIALTAHAMNGDKERVMEAGFTGYISKPFSINNLFDEIREIIRGTLYK
jgi:CheY-like chemotaxis protein